MISVVMPCYIMNERHLELTKNAIHSLVGVDELIIVDDNSLVGGGYLRSIADIYVKHRENKGFGTSVNRGLALAKHTYIAVSNNDIRVSPNWKSVIKEVFKSDDQVYSCHFRMTDYDTPIEYGNTIITSGKERWCHASFFAINTERGRLFFDEEFVNTYDDWDYFTTVRKIGLKQAYTDKAQFQHVHSATIPRMEKHTARNQANKEYFKKKWGYYAEELFTQDFPLQMTLPYHEGFKL